jgi:hypothetical protein
VICIRCGRPFVLRPNTPVMEDSRCRILAWGPKCARLAGMVKDKPRKPKPVKPPTSARGRDFAGQVDWIDAEMSQG